MIKKAKKTHIKEYLISIVISAVIAVSFCLFAELELLFRTEQRVNDKGFSTNNLAQFYTIELLEEKFEQDPENYLISLRLAQKYEELGQIAKANDYYEIALKVSNRANYVLYCYAMFCARQNLFALSITLCEELSLINKKTIEYKTNIYNQIAINLDKQGEYEASLKAYQVAFKYAKSLKKLSLFNSIKERYALEYVKLADKRMEKLNTLDAASDLKNSLNIKYLPTTEYKLGLIYLATDKKLAEVHIYNALMKDPYIVNPYVYNSVLMYLIKQAQERMDKSTYNYYSMKLARYKKILEHSYIYKEDIQIDGSRITMEKKLVSNKRKYYLDFDITNNSKYTINNLFCKVKVFINSNEYDIYSQFKFLQPSEVIEDTKIKLPSGVKFIDTGNNDVIIEYYFKKRKNAPWTLVGIDKLNF